MTIESNKFYLFVEENVPFHVLTLLTIQTLLLISPLNVTSCVFRFFESTSETKAKTSGAVGL